MSAARIWNQEPEEICEAKTLEWANILWVQLGLSWMMFVVVMWMCFFWGDLGFLRNFGSFCCRLRCVDNSGRTLILSAGSWRCVCSVPLVLLCDRLLWFVFLLKFRNITQVIFLDELVKSVFNSLDWSRRKVNLRRWSSWIKNKR